MSKLSYSIAINLLTNGVKTGAREIENTFKRMGSSIKNVIGTLGVGFGFAEFGRSMLDAGKNFESGMARVRAVTNSTEAEFKQMSAEAKRLGATTKYSASEAAGALENLTRNGLKPTQATAMLSKTLQLAQANGIELAEAADLCTNTMNAFGLAVEQSGRVNDNLSATAANSATNVSDLGMALATAAPLAKNVNASIEETCAALGTLANMGIKGADAGTSLKQFFMGLSTTTPQATKALAAYGLKINQTTLAQKGLNKTLEEMAKSGIGKDNQALAAVFGRRAFAGAATLINNYDKYSSLNGTLNNADGTTARMFEQGVGKVDNSIKSLQSAWEAFQISVFESSSSMFTAPIDGLTTLIRLMANDLPGALVKIGAAFAALKINKWFSSLKVSAATAFDGALAAAVKSNTKIAALQKQRVVIERQMANLEKKIAESTGDAKVLAEMQYQAKKKELQAQGVAFEKAMSERRAAIEKAQQAQSLTGWRAYWTTLKGGFSAVGTTIKNVWRSIAPVVVIEAVIELYNGLKRIIDLQSGATGVVKRYNEEIAKSTHTREITELEIIQKKLIDNKNNQAKIPGIIAEANKALGTHLNTYESVNKALREKIRLLKKAAEMEGVKNAIISLYQEQSEIFARHGVANQDEFDEKYEKEHGTIGDYWKFFTGGLSGKHSIVADYRRLSNIGGAIDRLSQRLEKIDDSTPSSTGGTSGTDTFTPKDIGGGGKTHKGAAEELESQQKNYAASLKELNIQLQRGWITESEYEKQLRELQRSAYQRTQTSEYAKVRESSFAQQLEKLIQASASDDMIRFAEITEKVGKAEVQYEKDINAGVKNQEELDSAMHQLYKEAVGEAASLDGLSATQKGLIQLWKQKGIMLEGVQATAGSAAHNPTNPNSKRDTTFDYKKSKKERLELDLDYTQKQLDSLKERAKTSLDDLSGAINEKMKNVTSLSDALKLEEFKEDIAEAKKSLVNNFFGSFGQLSSIISSFKSLSNTMASSDTSGLEKALAIISTLGNTVQSIISIYEAFKAVQMAVNMLSGAHAAIATQEAVANTTNAAAQTAAAGAAEAQAASSATTAVTNKIAAAAAEQLAAANIFLAHSYIPFAGVPIAAGYVATMEGVLAGVKAASVVGKFAHGGVVQGASKFGDMNLARVNDGEMILNGTQVKTVFDAINSGNLGGGGAISIQDAFVRGDKMYLAIDNYMLKNGKRWSTR